MNRQTDSETEIQMYDRQKDTLLTNRWIYLGWTDERKAYR